MKVFFQTVQVSTHRRTELIDITDKIEDSVGRSQVKDGICLVYSPHSTTAIIVNENEAGLREDIVRKVCQDYPKGAGWLHDRVDDNADAHLAASFIGPAKVLPVRDGRLVRGTWQNVFLLELDGPRSRRITIEVIGQ